MDNMVTLQYLLTALNVQDTVVRFNSSHPFAIGLGKSMQAFGQREKEYVEMGLGPLRLCSEPPYIGGDPDVVNEVNPRIEESRFDL